MTEPEIRLLGEEQSETICRLFYAADVDAEGYIWQDRWPDFFAFFRHLTPSGLIRVWGAFVPEHSDPIGSLSAVETPVRGLPKGVSAIYYTDAFVRPKHRGKRTYFRLREVSRDQMTSQFGARAFHYAVENDTQLLHKTREILESSGYAVHIGASRLHELYLTHPSPDRVDFERCRRVPLREMTNEQRGSFLTALDDCVGDAPLFPVVRNDIFDRFLKIDPEAYCVMIRPPGASDFFHCSAALIAVNFDSLRRFHYTGLAGLMPARLNQRRITEQRPPLQPHDPFRVILWSLHWNRPGKENDIEALLRFAYQHAYDAGFDCAVARDLPENSLRDFRNVIHRDNGIFTCYLKEGAALFESPIDGPARFRLDPAFL
ncbi:MAG: hypothetical protein A2X94_12145 [Bdellovibrionales bacterium GWB1_55_8]|nr:MAG: hypothetical protein A2X94_12145 [Bdellovibrionales bacterium GWB1_55_8]